MSTCTCRAINCRIPSDLELYSLQSGWRFRNQTYYFVMNCPPGYDCGGNYPITVVIPGDGTDVVIPDENVDPGTHRTIDDFTFTLVCCNSTMTTTVPGGSSLTEAQEIIQDAFYACAQARAACVQTEGNDQGRPPVPTWVGVPGPVWPQVCVGVPYFTLILTALPLTDVTLESGTLPPGLNFQMSQTQRAIISGTPTTAGAYTFVVRLVANNGSYTTKEYTINILGITNTPPDSEVGVAYTFSFTGTGGTAPFLFALESGSLPDGLTLLPSGTLSGVPTVDDAFDFTIRITDALGGTCTKAYIVVISPAAACVNWPTLDWLTNLYTASGGAGVFTTDFTPTGGGAGFNIYVHAPNPFVDAAAVQQSPPASIAVGGTTPCNCTVHVVCTKTGDTAFLCGAIQIQAMPSLANLVVMDFHSLAAGTYDQPFTVPAGTTSLLIYLQAQVPCLGLTGTDTSMRLEGYITNV